MKAGKFAIPFGPIIVGSSTEWAFEKERLAELRSLSSQTGGRQLSDLSKAWVRPPVLHYADLRMPLAITLLMLILLDALLTRTGWRLPEFDFIQRFRSSRERSKATQEALVTATVSNQIPAPPVEEKKKEKIPQAKSKGKPSIAKSENNEDSQTQRQSRFSRAKKGRE